MENIGIAAAGLIKLLESKGFALLEHSFNN